QAGAEPHLAGLPVERVHPRVGPDGEEVVRLAPGLPAARLLDLEHEAAGDHGPMDEPVPLVRLAGAGAEALRAGLRHLARLARVGRDVEHLAEPAAGRAEGAQPEQDTARLVVVRQRRRAVAGPL